MNFLFVSIPTVLLVLKDILLPLLSGASLTAGLYLTITFLPARHRRLAVLLGLWSILLVGLALRLSGAYGYNSFHPDSPARLIGDEPGYDNLAREFLHGYGFGWPGRVPLYPLWLAGVYLLNGGSYSTVLYFQAILGLSVILLVYLLAARIFNPAAGLIAAAWAAFSYILIHQTFHILSEILYTPVLLLAGLALWRAFQQPSLHRFLWAGAWIGLSNLVRPTLLLFPVFLLVVLLAYFKERRAVGYGLACLISSLLVVSPWVVHNYIRYGAIFPLQTSNAILWQGSPEYYRLIHDEGYTYLRIWTEVLYGPGWEARDPTSISGDRYWTQRALRSIASEPLIYIRYATEKLLTLWVGDPNADWNDSDIFDYQALRAIGFSTRDAIQVMIARALPVIALFAALVLFRFWPRLLPVYALLAYFTLLHALTHAEARLSEPLQPFLLVLLAGAAGDILQRASRNLSLDLPDRS